MDNKPWYEKIYIWIGIVAGIFGILGISIFGGKSLLNNKEDSNSTIKFEDNEIETGDQSPIIVGNNNTINYGNTEQDTMQNSKSNNLSSSESEELSVMASYQINPIQISEEGIDVLVTVKTSFPAERVTISSLSNENEETFFDMHGDTYNWYFNANFYIKGTYIITVTAYNLDGESVSDKFTYEY